jgi:hypothetical protein
MGSASDYTQVKVSVNSEIAAKFKKTCLESGVSMVSVLSSCMASYGGLSVKIK